jgi:hypothetical protein
VLVDWTEALWLDESFALVNERFALVKRITDDVSLDDGLGTIGFRDLRCPQDRSCLVELNLGCIQLAREELN